MRRTISFVCVIVLIVALSGCGSNITVPQSSQMKTDILNAPARAEIHRIMKQVIQVYNSVDPSKPVRWSNIKILSTLASDVNDLSSNMGVKGDTDLVPILFVGLTSGLVCAEIMEENNWTEPTSQQLVEINPENWSSLKSMIEEAVEHYYN